MTTDPEKTIAPTSSDEPATKSGDDADATTSGGAKLREKERVEASIRATAPSAMQTVRDYHATKAVG